jgi:hypothetical protein
MPIKPRSEKVLDRGRSGPIVVEIEQFGNFWSSLRLYYDVPTSNALLTRFYYDVTLTDADQRTRLLRYIYIATTVPIISRLKYASGTILAMIYISWVSKIIFQTSNMNERINADLIHLALLQQEQILVEIEIAQIVNRRRSCK